MEKGTVIRLKLTEKIIFSDEPYQYFIGRERTTELFLSNPMSTSPQIKSVLCKYWVATYLPRTEQSQLSAEKQAHTKQSAKTLPLGKQLPESQTFHLEKVSLKDLTSVFAWPWNPACLSKDTLFLDQQFSNTVVGNPPSK